MYMICYYYTYTDSTNSDTTNYNMIYKICGNNNDDDL